MQPPWPVDFLPDISCRMPNGGVLRGILRKRVRGQQTRKMLLMKACSLCELMGQFPKTRFLPKQSVFFGLT